MCLQSPPVVRAATVVARCQVSWRTTPVLASVVSAQTDVIAAAAVIAFAANVRVRFANSARLASFAIMLARS